MNIAEIAAMAGVSKAAVSRYFNDGYISEEKRQAIHKIVEETGYRPSERAQTLRTKKTNMVGVIAPKITSASIGRMIDGMLNGFNESGYRMLLAITQNDPEKELEYLSAFRDKQVDGIILIATVFTAGHGRMLQNLSVPVVIMGQQLPGYCCVFHDDYHAAYDLTKTMLEKERKKLGYIAATQQDQAVGERRYRGYKDAVCDMGYQELTGNVVTADFTVASGYEKAGELLRKYDGLDGIICATDTMAVGVVQYLQEHGIEVPGQILVAGHGDSELAKMMKPPLITVHYSYEKSGEIAVQMLMELLLNKESDTREVRLGYHIVG